MLLVLIRRSGSVRLLVLLLLVALLGGTALTLASLRPLSEDSNPSPLDRAAYDQLMAQRIRGLNDLLNWFYDQQDQLEPIIPPGLELLHQPGWPEVVVWDPTGRDWPGPLTEALSDLIPSWRNSVPTYELDLQEDVQGQITIRDARGNILYVVPTPSDYQVPYEALYRASLNPRLYEPMLNRYKLRSRIVLLPQAYVEPYLYVHAELAAAVLAASEGEGGGTMRMMGGGTCSEITFAAIELSTNRVDVGLCVPDGITNVDVFASANLMPDGFPWAWVATNLAVTTNRVVWSWENLEATNVFLAAGDANQDTDGDGLSDAREFYLYGTLLNGADTDGDGLGDGWETAMGLTRIIHESCGCALFLGRAA